MPQEQGTMKKNDPTRKCPECGAEVPGDAPQGLCPKCVLSGAATSVEPNVSATATSEIPSLERVAEAFPQFEILELIGRGGMGFVYKARQPHLDRLVALKLLPDKLAKDPQFAERFNREAKVVARLNHPNIVSVFDFGQTEHFYFLLMEYVDGVNLRQAMQAGRFSPGEALSIVPKICDALQFAHQEGILHRDIKPENILLDSKGGVKIADFGIAKLIGEDQSNVTLTNTGSALGTPHYMAPEQLEKPSEVDHRADIYSLGVVFYEMLTGELPMGRFSPPSDKTPVDARVDDVVFRTLEKERDKRFQSADAVKTSVENIRQTSAGGQADSFKQAKASSKMGPHGTMVMKRAYSQKAIWGSVLAAISLICPLGLMLVLTFVGGLGIFEILIISVPFLACGLGGTILGWIALNDIRSSKGMVQGLPLALFAALT
jgi:serine/threonine protein kinase